MTPRLLAAAALGLALTATACSTIEPPDAARVGDFTLTVGDLEDQLDRMVDDPNFQPQRPITDPATGLVSNDFTRQLLFVNTLGAFAAEANAERGATVSTEQGFEAQVAGQAASVMGFNPGTGQWELVEPAVREPIEEDVAQILTLIESYRGDADDPAAVRALYDAQPDRFALLCARHILVPSEQAADRVLDRLAAGEEFATVAAEVSDDPGSAADGGRLYTDDAECPPANQFVPEFVAGALAATPGEPSEPVQTEFGWHVIVVDEVQPRPFDEVQAEVAEVVRQEATQRLIDDFGAADIWINPRFGTWDAEAGFIQAPEPGPAG